MGKKLGHFLPAKLFSGHLFHGRSQNWKTEIMPTNYYPTTYYCIATLDLGLKQVKNLQALRGTCSNVRTLKQIAKNRHWNIVIKNRKKDEKWQKICFGRFCTFSQFYRVKIDFFLGLFVGFTWKGNLHRYMDDFCAVRQYAVVCLGGIGNRHSIVRTTTTRVKLL